MDYTASGLLLHRTCSNTKRMYDPLASRTFATMFPGGLQGTCTPPINVCQGQI